MGPVRRVGCGTLLVGCLGTGLWATQALARDIPNDGQHSVARFQLDLPLGRELDGQFPLMKTEWLPQADGRWRVAVSLPTDDVKIPGRPQYTRIMRGKMFFDSLHHPRVHFLSDAFDAPLLTTGGAMSGVMEIRGVKRRQTLRLAPTTCRPPAPRLCVIEVQGEVSRAGYGMTSLKSVVGDAVKFRLRVVHGAES